MNATNGSPDVKMEDADTDGHVDPGLSIRFGPVQDKDTGMDDADSSAGKRKSRASIGQPNSYAEPESSEEEDQPLVRYDCLSLRHAYVFPHMRRFAVAVDCNG